MTAEQLTCHGQHGQHGSAPLSVHEPLTAETPSKDLEWLCALDGLRGERLLAAEGSMMATPAKKL
jgi:hypothetical protein